MSTALTPERSALLVMDFQVGIVENFAANSEVLLSRVEQLLSAARRSGVLVVYVVVGFRPGFPEVSPRNKSFGQIRQSGRFGADDPQSAIHPRLAPEPGDVVITKHRVSAFMGTDLDMILRASDRDTLLLAGIATSGVVLSTLRHAADADYRLLVVEDACSDRDEEVHRVLTQKVFARQADVVGTEQALDLLAQAPAARA